MSETKRTQGVDVDKYRFYEPPDPEAKKAEAEKSWNHRKLKKVIMNDYILSYQELLEMRLVFQSDVESAENDLEILQQKVEATKDRVKRGKEKVKEWDAEIAQAERDIPEIGEKAEAERKYDEEKRAKHEANLKGKGKGRAFELNAETGEMEDRTGSRS